MRVMRATAMTFVLAVLLPTQAMGQSLVDPTRPPAHAAGVEASGGGDSEVEPRIQSILLSPGRKLAVIDGETVRLGAKHRGATVVSITPTQVVLKEGDSRRVLKLHPRVDKKERATTGATGRPGDPTQ